ncbi:hypothetical protein SteCoe_15122 [Stentor coeruleus]|uniref:Ion transport domain-containing protein n=1 Tax=Stentor coeruleus TaxID=5963 RepID=A0A1R2C4E3_9CILI|nr:hypothetical protein SteCoe_15122 [Stentor coeruleus]
MMEEKTAEVKIFENSIVTTRKIDNVESQENKHLLLEKSFEHKEDEVFVENVESKNNNLVNDNEKYDDYVLTESLKSLEDDTEVDVDNFWSSSVTWDTRKIIAEKNIRKNKDRYLVHFLAFEGEIEKIFEILDPKENKNCCNLPGNGLEKDNLGLSPIIYAIWGELNRKDEVKATSQALLLISFEAYNKFSIKILDRYGYYHENSQRKKKMFYYDRDLKNELALIYLHNIDQSKTLTLFSIISEDYFETLIYIYEKTKFKLSIEKCNHPQLGDMECSFLLFAIKVKAVKCADWLLKLVISNIKSSGDNSDTYKLIENEISGYLSAGSLHLPELLELLINTQNKPRFCDSSKFPECKGISLAEISIAKNAYNIFDNIPGESELINCQIMNTKIRLPLREGSKRSVEFFQTLTSSQNIALFKEPLVMYFIKYKWDKLWFIAFIQSLLIWTNIPLIFVLIFVDKGDTKIIWAFIAINIILAMLELVQIISLGIFKYLGNVDKDQTLALIRLCSLGLQFLSSFQPFCFIIYATLITLTLTLSIPFIALFIAIYSIFGCVFIGFWIDWSETWYLSIAEGCIVFIISIIMSLVNDKRIPTTIMHCISLSLVISLLTLEKNELAIQILAMCFQIGFFFTKLGLCCCRNSRKVGACYDFVINSIVVFLLFIEIIRELNLQAEVYKEILSLYFSFIQLTLIALNISESYIQAIVVIGFECLLILEQIQKRVIYAHMILPNIFKLFGNWNMIDSSRLVLCFIWAGFLLNNIEYKQITYTVAVLTVLRGLTGFRCFSITRYYIRLIFNALHDVYSFLLIFFYSTFSFGIICGIYQEGSLSEIWMYAYDLNLGSGYHSNTFDITYITFFVATVVNVIVMLNLLISILGDSFDKFQLSAKEIDYMEMADSLSEIETMIFWRRNYGNEGMYLVACSNDKKENSQWEGKIMSIKKEVKEIRDMISKHDEKFVSSEKRLESIEKGIAKILEKLE